MEFKTYDLDSAPEGSVSLLENIMNNYGWIPNQNAVMAESPSLLESYQKSNELFIKGSLSDEERAVVWICTGSAHNCMYTVTAHEFIAKKSGVKDELLLALMSDEKLPFKLEALRIFTTKLATSKGFIDPSDVEIFIDAGYSKSQVFEVILGVSQKTMSTMMNNIAGTSLDEVFSKELV